MSISLQQYLKLDLTKNNEEQNINEVCDKYLVNILDEMLVNDQIYFFNQITNNRFQKSNKLTNEDINKLINDVFKKLPDILQ